MRQWCGRARECFDRCNHKTGVNFPDEARGWISLQCSGMSEEEQAVVLARTQSELKFDAMAVWMRSCLPDFTVPKRRATGAHLVETKSMAEVMGSVDDEDPNVGVAEFQDIELFLAEHVEDDTAPNALTKKMWPTSLQLAGKRNVRSWLVSSSRGNSTRKPTHVVLFTLKWRS